MRLEHEQKSGAISVDFIPSVSLTRKMLGDGEERKDMARILIIDDDAQVLVTLRQLLKREGYEVVEASDGNEGIRLYRENPTDVIITDLLMPEKEGLETIMDLRKAFPDVKIIAMSGGRQFSPEDYLNMAKNLGAKYAFAKPIEKQKLLNAVQELLR